MGFDLPEGDGQPELPDPSSTSTPDTSPRDVTSTPSAFPAVSSRVLEPPVCWSEAPLCPDDLQPFRDAC